MSRCPLFSVLASMFDLVRPACTPRNLIPTLPNSSSPPQGLNTAAPVRLVAFSSSTLSQLCLRVSQWIPLQVLFPASIVMVWLFNCTGPVHTKNILAHLKRKYSRESRGYGGGHAACSEVLPLVLCRLLSRPLSSGNAPSSPCLRCRPSVQRPWSRPDAGIIVGLTAFVSCLSGAATPGSLAAITLKPSISHTHCPPSLSVWHAQQSKPSPGASPLGARGGPSPRVLGPKLGADGATLGAGPLHGQVCWICADLVS